MNETQVQQDQKVFELAERFLFDLVKVHVLHRSNASDDEARQLLDKYFRPLQKNHPPSLTGASGIYYHLVHAAQDYNMAKTVIGDALGGIQMLAPVLYDFNPTDVVKTYSEMSHWEKLFERIVKQLNPRGQLRITSRSLWPRFCKSVISGATFLSQFKDADSFYDFVNSYDRNDNLRANLPTILSQQVYGSSLL